MKILGAVAVIALSGVIAMPAVAAEGLFRDVPTYFSPSDAPTHQDVIERYPRPLSTTAHFRIPAGSGAAVPVDPFALPDPYGLGEAWVGVQYEDAKGRATYDAKGRATFDRRGPQRQAAAPGGRVAWDGQSDRMTFNDGPDQTPDAATSGPAFYGEEDFSTADPAGPGCSSSNTYGAVSCVTGAPRTELVSGYTRKDGKYVKPYYRSHR